ncbi:hypothetical protein Plim_4300 (plasmid) [Planctopirus limnophila DSM 3776]|uniref:Uncharacterized protein n=1 Tax=Planctopirus limnophila (strain ATCC 43296 / DSM 3776 / IFAM 1008 / Mu 290) TaxID=521674 RepID=D5SZI7_PLAL2|nr:hypothetical protein [Planctopirus limnophila]ADG70107.1 hypothetical protein Plim_4300 [Planctopirus limnophila DSM 3776]
MPRKRIPLEPRACEYCGTVYMPDRVTARWCQSGCYARWLIETRKAERAARRIVYEMVCPICDIKFQTSHHAKKFCSEKCQARDSSQRQIQRLKIDRETARRYRRAHIERLRSTPEGRAKIKRWNDQKNARVSAERRQRRLDRDKE